MTDICYRIFISSPGDMSPERHLAERVIQRVDASLPGVKLECFLSERIPYFAHQGPQDGIPLSREFDLVVCLFWKRIGSELLPEHYDLIEADGKRRKRTGSEFEFETAVEAAKRNQRGGVPVPGVFAYRKTADVLYRASHVDEERAQHQALEAFFERWIKDATGHFLGYAHKFERPSEFERVFERHLRDWLAMQRRGTDWDVSTQGSPFRGLEVFERQHASVYFGRERAVLQARSKLKKSVEDGFPVLWIVGASGSGKSSLLRAGLIPSLERTEDVVTVLFKPSDFGQSFFIGLAEKLALVFPRLFDANFSNLEALSRVLANPDTEIAVDALRTALNHEASKHQQQHSLDEPPVVRLLLAIDQAEELLSQSQAEDRSQFAKLCTSLATAKLGWVVLSFRSDFYSMLQNDAHLQTLKASAQQLDIGPPGPEDIILMIEGPCRAAGLILEVSEDGRSLQQELSQDCTGPDSLPMLQLALSQLHQQAHLRRPFNDNMNKLLTIESYIRIGRAAGALTNVAERAFAALPERVQTCFPRLLSELVDVNLQADRMPAARNCQDSIFANDRDTQVLIAALVEHRLLTRFEVQGQNNIRVVHESLLERWPRAKILIVSNARRFDAKRRITEAHLLWQSEKSDKRLLEGIALEEGLDLAKADELHIDVVRFVSQSKRRSQRRTRTLVAVFGALALVAGLAAFGFLRQSERAEHSAANSLKNLMQAAERALGRAREQAKNEERSTAAAYLAESLSYEPSRSAEDAALILQQIGGPALLAFLDHGSNLQGASTPDDLRVEWERLATKSQIGEFGNGADRLDRQRHRRVILPARFSPDGTLVVAASTDFAAHIYDSGTGAKVGAALRHEGEVTYAVFSPDGRRVVTASFDGTAQMWDAKTGSPLGAPMRHNGIIWTATFSADSQRVVTASFDKTAQLWDAQTGGALGATMRHEGNVMSAAFSPDGRRVVTASSDNTARVWDAQTGAALDATMRHEGNVMSAVFNPDGRRVVTASLDNTARLWDAQTGEELGRLQHQASVRSAAFSPDGLRVVTTTSEGAANIWDASDGRIISGLGYRMMGLSAAFSPDGRRMVTSGGMDNTAQIWDASTKRALGLPFRHSNLIRSAVFSPDGTRVATASEDNVTQIWDTRSKAALGLTFRHREPVISAAFSPDGGRLVTVSLDNTAQVWSVGTGLALGSPLRHSKSVSSAAFSPDATRVVTASLDGTSQIWDSVSGQAIGSTLRHRAGVLSATFSPNGARVVTACIDGMVQFWDAASGLALRPPLPHKDRVNSINFSPNGARLLSASDDKTAQIWDANTGSALLTLRHEFPVKFAAFSPDGHRVITFGASELFTWDAATGSALGPPLRFEELIQDANFSRDGKRVVTASDKFILIWDAEMRVSFSPSLVHEGPAFSAAFSPDGSLVASTSGYTVKTWEVQTSEMLGSPVSPDNLVALSGRRIGENGQLEWVPGSGWMKLIDTVKAEALIGATKKDAIIRWHFSDRSTRTLSPFSQITVPKHIEREIAWALVQPQTHESARSDPRIPKDTALKALNDAYALDPGHPLILLALAVRGSPEEHWGTNSFSWRINSRQYSPETKALWKRLSFPRIEAKPENATRAAEILQQDKDPENAKRAAEIALKYDPSDQRASLVLAWASTELAKAQTNPNGNPASKPNLNRVKSRFELFLEGLRRERSFR